MSNLRLNQVLALDKGAKPLAEGALTTAYHLLQRPLFDGISRTYQPRDEEGDQLPPESTKLQLRVPQVLRTVVDPLTRWLDLTVTKDSGNQDAVADVVVDGTTILTAVPVTTLLTLEKKLVDFATAITKVPVLDPAQEWEWDPENDCWRTPITKTTKTKKVPRNHVLAGATDKHAAQVQMYNEDVIVGDWSTIKFSGALSPAQQRALLEKVTALRQAVKLAREEANMTVVGDRKIGAAIFDYLAW